MTIAAPPAPVRPPRGAGSRARGVAAAAACLLWALAGCRTPAEFVEEADADSYAIVAAARQAAGQAPDADFSIAPGRNDLRSSLLAERLAEVPAGPRERLARDGVTVEIDLAGALAIAARNSRDFQDQRENLYLAALNLTTQIHAFETRWFGTVAVSGALEGDGDDSVTPSVSENASLGFTRLLETGGSLSLALGQSFTRFFSNPADSVAGGFIDFVLSIPLLRGAGRAIAYERVTQAERDVVYAVRAFETFKRSFAVDVVSDYLRLLQALQRVENEINNLERRRLTAEENRDLGEAGRIPRTDVERANQSVLTAENRLIVAQQSFENQLDAFKFTLGLPTDATIAVRIADLAELREAGLEESIIGEERAVLTGLVARLDLATAEARVQDARRRVLIAEDALRAGLDFTVTSGLDAPDLAEDSFQLDLVGDGSLSVGALLDLPLDRRDERNAYRASLIDFQRNLRDAEAAEDQVKLEVRRSVRNLQVAAETYEIQTAAVTVAEVNEDAAKLLKAAGEGRTIDVVDAQNDLIDAQNAVTDALVDYTIARLSLLRDMGVLVVQESGIDDEMTRRLMEETP